MISQESLTKSYDMHIAVSKSSTAVGKLGDKFKTPKDIIVTYNYWHYDFTGKKLIGGIFNCGKKLFLNGKLEPLTFLLGFFKGNKTMYEFVNKNNLQR